MDNVDPKALIPLVAGEWRRARKRVVIDARGDSMAPLILPGDRLELQMDDPASLRPGDVFAFLRDGQIVVHRLISVGRRGQERRFCEKGDGLPGWNWVEEAAVLGRVEGIQREGRRLDLRRAPWAWVDRGAALSWSAWILSHECLRTLHSRVRAGCGDRCPAAAVGRGLSRGAHLADRFVLGALRAGRWR